MTEENGRENPVKRIFWAASTYSSENYQIDPKDDTSKPFNKIHDSSERFLQQMVELVRYSSIRTTSREWAKNLRFLEIQQAFGTRPSQPSSTAADSPFLEEAIHGSLGLTLTDRQPSSGSANYVAVSYCWYRPNIAWFMEQGLPSIPISKHGQSLGSTGPQDILYRASNYALRQGLKRIWIDQYCIDQEDPRDKQDGIQAMDLVYQLSSHPVAILESFVETQAQLEAFASLFTGDMLEVDRLDDLEQVLEHLAKDAWFTRAWTLQESTSAGVTTALLIGCAYDLDKPDVFGPAPGELEITVWDFQNAMVTARLWMEEFSDIGILENNSTASCISNCADDLLNFLPLILPDSRERGPSHRQVCNAAEAVNALQDRKNTVFSDRLAILSNLCDYEIRLQDNVLDVPQHSFSTCVLTLSLLNGDMSLLGKYSDPYSRSYLARDGRNSVGFMTDMSDSALNRYGFSWGPAPTGSLRNIEFYDQHDEAFRVQPATLSANGLRLRGILWQMSHQIPLPHIRQRFAGRWDEELKLQEDKTVPASEADSRSECLANEFIWTLLQDLVRSGYRDLAFTLWNHFQPRRRSNFMESGSRKAPPLYSFSKAFDPQHFQNEQNIKDGLTTSSLAISRYDSPQIPTFTRMILQEVCASGALVCGSENCADAPRVLFESCEKGDLVFTPLTKLGDKVCTESIFKNQAVSWKVIRTGRAADGCEILHCLGRRRGVYRMEDLKARDWILE